MAHGKKAILIIGGTGAQGMPVVRSLSEGSTYEIRVLTRSAKSSSALDLATLPDVTIIEGDAYDEATLYKVFKDINLAWINTNGFAIGEKNEIYWGIRMFEIARASGVSHFQWASLPYLSKLGNFHPKYRTGHMDGKGKVADYISTQPSNTMKWSILSSCMYMETLAELLAPRPSPDDPDVLIFSAPVGNGKPPLIYLADLGRYARWIFDHPELSNGLNLQVATENVGWQYLADSFTEATGKRAFFKDVTLDEYFSSGVFPFPDGKNFSGFWNSWKDDLVRVDYALLDEILPTRVKSVGEWMELVGYTGQRTSVLKDYRDRAKT